MLACRIRRKAAATDIALDEMRDLAQSGIEFGRRKLSTEQRAYLAGLPLTFSGESCQFVHASLNAPGEWRYIMRESEAQEHFKVQTKPLCFCGHTHVPTGRDALRRRNMTFVFAGLAFIGVILVILGWRILIEDARGFSEGWAWAIRLLPLADMMYLARFWDSAKTGAFMSIAGLLLLPAGGKALWDQKHPSAGEVKTFSLSADDRNGLFQSMKFEHEERISRKQQKLQTLNARVAAWYQSMESRRPPLANAAPAEVAAFNEEAATYTAFRAVPIREAAELAKLQAKRCDSRGAISDEEYRGYQEMMERAGGQAAREDDDAA